MVREPRIALLVLGLALIAAGCADGPRAGPAAGRADSPAPGPTETSTRVPQSDVFFASLLPGLTVQDVSGAGILEVRDGCLILDSGPVDQLPLWAPGYSYEDGTLLDPAGHEVAGLGEWVRGAGGNVGSDWEWLEQQLAEPVPQRCRLQVRNAVDMYDVEHAPELAGEYP